MKLGIAVANGRDRVLAVLAASPRRPEIASVGRSCHCSNVGAASELRNQKKILFYKQ